MFAGKKSAQIREILISESAWEEMTCLFAPSLKVASDNTWRKNFNGDFKFAPEVSFLQGIETKTINPKEQYHVIY